MFLHENRFHFPQENNSIALPYKMHMADVRTLYIVYSIANAYMYYMAGQSERKWSNLIGSLSGWNPAVRTGFPD
jgi:hypothetical protein